MVATNDDILTALNKLIELNTPKVISGGIAEHHIFHNNVEVELNNDDGKYYLKEEK